MHPQLSMSPRWLSFPTLLPALNKKNKNNSCEIKTEVKFHWRSPSGGVPRDQHIYDQRCKQYYEGVKVPFNDLTVRLLLTSHFSLLTQHQSIKIMTAEVILKWVDDRVCKFRKASSWFTAWIPDFDGTSCFGAAPMVYRTFYQLNLSQNNRPQLAIKCCDS